jgi:hypothetical protein
VLIILEDVSVVARGQVLRRHFGFPSNLPRLATLRPPGGNSRSAGIHNSFYEQRHRGELPEFY